MDKGNLYLGLKILGTGAVVLLLSLALRPVYQTVLGLVVMAVGCGLLFPYVKAEYIRRYGKVHAKKVVRL